MGRKYGKQRIIQDIQDKFSELLDSIAAYYNLDEDNSYLKETEEDFKKEVQTIVEDIEIEYDDLTDHEMERFLYEYSLDCTLGVEEVESAVRIVQKGGNGYMIIQLPENSMVTQGKVEQFIERLKINPF